MTDKIEDGGPAFPHQDSGDTGTRPGMTLRDYFAAHAPPMPDQWFKDSPRKLADPLWHFGEASSAWSYFYADAMLKERAR